MVALSAFSGTVFALVLAARQIRGQKESDAQPAVLRYRLADSIAVTAELAISAALGVLYVTATTAVFYFFVPLVSLTGIVLSTRAAIAFVSARREGLFRVDSKSDTIELIQTFGNALPILCYVVAFLFGTGVFALDVLNSWEYAFVATWLTFSGCFQAIFWYARIWKASKPGP